MTDLSALGLPEPDVLARIKARRNNGPCLRILLVMPLDPSLRNQVESLRRALSMLGHHVFTVSATRHDGLIRKSESGGSSTRSVNLKSVSPILDTFDPDVVLVPNAGYSVEASSQELASRRGIVLLFLDTLPKAEGTAGPRRYDVMAGGGSADSAALSLPFYLGADASLAFSRTPRDPAPLSFAVMDGSAMAQSYPDLSAKLAADADFRGAGEPAPDSAESENLARALVHIYPPVISSQRQTLWRCMVSLLSGSAVVVPEKLRLPAHFAALSAVFTYRGESGLEELLQRLKVDAGDLGQAANQDAAILQSSYLYEDQFHHLIEAIRDYAQADLGAFAPGVRQRIKERWSASVRPRGPVVAISGWYGERNIGDELILDVLAQALRRVNPHGQVVVAAPRPSRVEQDHGLAAMPRHEMKSMAQLAQYADALIIGGGGIWNDKAADTNGGLAGLFQNPRHSVVNLATLPVLFQAVGKPIAGLGLGVGPLRERSGRAYVRLMASLCSIISVRDSNSQSLLEELAHAGAEPSQDGDLAFAWAVPVLPPRPGTHVQAPLRVGVNVRAMDNTDPLAANHLWPGLAESLRRLENDFNCAFIGVPFQSGDESELRLLFDAVGARESVVLPFTMDPSQAAADLGSVDVLVSMRLHASILGHRQGVPAVGLSYEAKISDYFREAGESDRLVGPDAPAGELFNVISATLRDRAQIRERLRPVINAMEGAARERLDGNVQSLLALTEPGITDFWSLTSAETR